MLECKNTNCEDNIEGFCCTDKATNPRSCLAVIDYLKHNKKENLDISNRNTFVYDGRKYIFPKD